MAPVIPDLDAHTYVMTTTVRPVPGDLVTLYLRRDGPGIDARLKLFVGPHPTDPNTLRFMSISPPSVWRVRQCDILAMHKCETITLAGGKPVPAAELAREIRRLAEAVPEAA